MRFQTDISGYLDGSSFSSGLRLTIARPEFRNLYRLPLLEKLVRGKKVLHVGCVDHLESLDAKIAGNIWLHGRLCRSAAFCAGVDINKRGIEYLKSKYGYADLWACDITQSGADSLPDKKWDYVIIGEVLEHLPDPGAFLKSIHLQFKGRAAMVLISVPNATAMLSFWNALGNREFINSDHRYYFSPYTLAKSLTDSGYTVDEFFFCENWNVPQDDIRKRIRRMVSPATLLSVLSPAVRDTVVMSAFF